MPDLQNICRRIVIPDTLKMAVKVKSSEYVEYENFYVDLISCEELKLILFKDDQIITDLKTISDLSPEILRSDDGVDDRLCIICSFMESPGGKLWIKTNDIKIYDQVENELSLTELENLCQQYWE